jgi:hypothetical protein
MGEGLVEVLTGISLGQGFGGTGFLTCAGAG